MRMPIIVSRAVTVNLCFFISGEGQKSKELLFRVILILKLELLFMLEHEQ